jgi:hypothetical protein
MEDGNDDDASSVKDYDDPIMSSVDEIKYFSII